MTVLPTTSPLNEPLGVSDVVKQLATDVEVATKVMMDPNVLRRDAVAALQRLSLQLNSHAAALRALGDDGQRAGQAVDGLAGWSQAAADELQRPR